MNSISDDLKERKIVPIKDAAAAAGGIDQRTFLRRMAEQDIPVIWLGPRKRGMLLAHFDELIAGLAKPALKVVENAG